MCFHEALSGNNENAFNEQMVPWSERYNFVGSADTNPISLGRIKGRISGPMVMVLRPEEDVRKSLHRVFDPHPSFNNEEWEAYIYNMVDMYSIALEWYRLHEPELLIIDFKDLEDEQTLQQIWRHCVPVEVLPWSYIREMNNTRITVKRRQGLANGIETSLKYMDQDIDFFKKAHIDNYDRDKFKADFWREPDPEEDQKLKLVKSPKKREYMGSRNKAVLAH